MEFLEELDDATIDAMWDAVRTRFGFRREGLTEFINPPECVAFRPPYFDDPAVTTLTDGQVESFYRAVAVYNERCARVLQRAFIDEVHILILDWQHDCFRFRLHAMEPARWSEYAELIAAPTGDQRFFLPADLSCAMFGGVRERLYLFGRRMIDAAEGEELGERVAATS